MQGFVIVMVIVWGGSGRRSPFMAVSGTSSLMGGRWGCGGGFGRARVTGWSIWGCFTKKVSLLVAEAGRNRVWSVGELI